MRRVLGKDSGAERSFVDRVRAVQRGDQANKRCADCPERGPTYVCLDFRTFVCQTCCGIHREFGHRIKSISLSSWSEAEVTAIEEGGNARAAAQWMAKWKHGDMPEPDNTDQDRVRGYIKEKYREKRWWKEVPAEQLAAIGSNCAAKREALVATAAPAASAEAPQQQSKQPPPAAVTSPPKGVAAPLTDLLSGGADEAPLTALAVQTSSANGGSSGGWTADFAAAPAPVASVAAHAASAEPRSVPAPSAAAAGLLDIDFSAAYVAPVAQTPAPLVLEAASVPAAASALPAATAAAATAPVAPSSAEGLLSLDVTPASNPPAQMPSQQAVMPTASGPPVQDPNTLGDRLRQAVLNGSGDEVLKLFQQCNALAATPLVSANPLGGIGASTNAAGATRAEAQPGRFAALQEISFEDFGGGTSRMPALLGAGLAGSTALALAAAPPQIADPPGSPSRSSAACGASADSVLPTHCSFFYIGDEDSPKTPSHGSPSRELPSPSGVPTGLAPAPALVAGPPRPATGAAVSAMPGPGTQLATGVSQLAAPCAGTGGAAAQSLTAGLTPQQLAQLNPRELMQMQSMIAQALQVRQGGAPSQPAPSLAGLMAPPGGTPAGCSGSCAGGCCGACGGGGMGGGHGWQPGGMGGGYHGAMSGQHHGAVPPQSPGAVSSGIEAPSPASPPAAGPKQFDDLMKAFTAKNPVLGMG